MYIKHIRGNLKAISFLFTFNMNDCLSSAKSCKELHELWKIIFWGMPSSKYLTKCECKLLLVVVVIIYFAVKISDTLLK